MQTTNLQKRPYLTPEGVLVIGPWMFKKYHWWAKGQSIAMTMIELAVDLETWARYTPWDYMDAPEFHEKPKKEVA